MLSAPSLSAGRARRALKLESLASQAVLACTAAFAGARSEQAFVVGWAPGRTSQATSHRTTVSRHREVKPTTARGIYRQLGVHRSKESNPWAHTSLGSQPKPQPYAPTDLFSRSFGHMDHHSPSRRGTDVSSTPMTAPHRPKQIHPFPARMAPELALAALKRAPHDAVILDPMCGSGTVLQHAREHDMSAYGYDIDPLAILVTRVTCTRIDGEELQRAAKRLVERAQTQPDTSLPWLDSDPTTSAYVDYWFHPRQQEQLRQLASALKTRRGKVADALRVALSRTIITKDVGASLARDVSHSRPHRVRETNDFDVYKGFLQAVKRIAPLLDEPGDGKIHVAKRDARHLPRFLRGRIDLVITSPPYLNAIDYMRGHRMSLVWLGYQINELTTVRSNSVGAERYPDHAPFAHSIRAPRYPCLSSQQRGMLDRYAYDISGLMSQLNRVLSARGEAVIVVGDSMLNGTRVRNSIIIRRAAEKNGLILVDEQSRPLPTSSRYLPPPASIDGPLSKRMRHEVILRFAHSRGPKDSANEQL